MQVVCYRMLPLMPGSLEVKLPTYGQRKQQWWEESEKRERESEEKSQRREKQKREDQSARKGRKVRKHCVFPMFFGSGGSKSRLKRGCGAICSDERSKNCHCCGTKRSTVFFRGKRDGFSTSPKVSETWRLSGNLKNHGRRGTFEQDLQRCITQGRRGTRDMSADMFGGQGADFLRGVVFLEHQILRFAEVVLRDRCSTSHDLALLREMGWKNARRHWYKAGSALGFHQLSIFEGSLAELLRFLTLSKIQNMRMKPRRISSFWSCEHLFFEEVSRFWTCQLQLFKEASQKCFVFCQSLLLTRTIAWFQIDG